MKLNCLIIGLGVGEKHLNTLLSLKDVKITGICDFNKKKLNKIKNKYKNNEKLSNCKFSDDFDDLLKIEGTDLAVIASYDNFHFQHIKKLSSKKVNIFIEKPLCQSISEFIKIKKLISKNKIFISSNFVLRENPIFKSLKKNIENKKLGEIYHFEGEYNYGRIQKLHKGWRGKINFYSVNQGGAIHILDLILFLKEMKLKKVYSLGNNINSKSSNFKHFDISTNIFKFEDKTTAKITSNFSSVTPHHHKLSIYGTKGSFEYNFINNIYFFSRDYQKKKIKVSKNIYDFNKSNVLKKYVKLILKKDYKLLNKYKKDLYQVTEIILKMDKNLKFNNFK